MEQAGTKSVSSPYQVQCNSVQLVRRKTGFGRDLVPGELVHSGSVIQIENTRVVNKSGKGTNRLIFNVGGNEYRILCKYQFGKKMVHLFVLWIGTHAEYDKLCAEGKQYTIEKY